MNFIDRYKEELEQEETQEDAVKKMMQDILGEKIMGNGLEKSLTDMRRIASNFADVALIFYDKLKGKFTSKQIADIVCTVIGGLTP